MTTIIIRHKDKGRLPKYLWVTNDDDGNTIIVDVLGRRVDNFPEKLKTLKRLGYTWEVCK